MCKLLFDEFNGLLCGGLTLYDHALTVRSIQLKGDNPLVCFLLSSKAAGVYVDRPRISITDIVQ